MSADSEPTVPPRREQEAVSGLTIAQQRALLRMKSARLLAQSRRCSPARPRELALADSASPAVIREASARHQMRDESLSRAFAAILQNELQNS